MPTHTNNTNPQEDILNIVIPMAGNGTRFQQKGYTKPKPLIDIHSIPMIAVVMNNIKPQQKHRFILICQKKHTKDHELQKHIQNISNDVTLIEIDKPTKGQLCTVLLAKDYINSNNPLMIANSDQFVTYDINQYLQNSLDYDGFIMTFNESDPKWSYAKIDGNNNVTQVAEKVVISNEATVGIYNFKHGKDFVKAADTMIEKQITHNGEYYVSPVYNELISTGKKIGYKNIGKLQETMHGLGTPNDLENFLKNPQSKKWTSELGG